jgi:hypothetical protein
MKEETVAELQSILYQQFKAEVDTEHAKLLAHNYTEFFHTLEDIEKR